jgi:hypothetical protein
MVKNIKAKKRLTSFTLVLALMTGSVAELAVLLYRGARIVVVSSLSFAAENGVPSGVSKTGFSMR